MPSLFDAKVASTPLADRIRPTTLSDFVGQEHLVSEGKIIYELLKIDKLPSLIFWGPPGCGKTSLAEVIACSTKSDFIKISATTSGIGEVKKVVEKAADKMKNYGHQTILFIDEIHRFNKAQQDPLLPYVEKGVVTLIGATTENPSFEVISPLLSRSKVLVLKELTAENIKQVLIRGAKELGFKDLSFVDKKGLESLINYSNGDARVALNALETSVNIKKGRAQKITKDIIEQALQTNLRYDRLGEEHYNTISAFIKSIRASNPNAALYYLARMVEAGEDPLFIARRMVVFASEDIGMAQPAALMMANEVFRSCETIGYPECQENLAHGAVYLALAKKDRSAVDSFFVAMQDVRNFGNLPIPLSLRNAPTKLMKDLNYGKGYQAYPDKSVSLLPEKLKGRRYYKTPQTP